MAGVIGGLGNFLKTMFPLKKISADSRERLFRKLQLLDAATSDADLPLPPSNHLEKLRGTLEGFHSIRVNDQWRLIFRWGDGKAVDVYWMTIRTDNEKAMEYINADDEEEAG